MRVLAILQSLVLAIWSMSDAMAARAPSTPTTHSHLAQGMKKWEKVKARIHQDAKNLKTGKKPGTPHGKHHDKHHDKHMKKHGKNSKHKQCGAHVPVKALGIRRSAKAMALLEGSIISWNASVVNISSKVASGATTKNTSVENSVRSQIAARLAKAKINSTIQAVNTKMNSTIQAVTIAQAEASSETSKTTSASGFEITEGACTIEDQCVLSPNEPAKYPNSASDPACEVTGRNPQHLKKCTPDCVITVTDPRPLSVEMFYVETNYDALYVNDKMYTGRGVEYGPQNVVATSEIKWFADSSVSFSGWKICKEGSWPPEEKDSPSSMATPGAGSVQTLATETGGSGTVAGEQLYVKVLKDGFFSVGCLEDAMLEFGDKFGNGKFKYGTRSGHSAVTANISIVKYKELVHDDAKQAMTPEVCFEFCRTIKDMVYFGINNGDDCYCEPYYKKVLSDTSTCEVPCVGDTTRMCGGTKKSTIWEMHLCDDTAEDLKTGTSYGMEVLTFFYEGSALAVELGDKVTKAGVALGKVAGLSGANSVRSLAVAATNAGSTLSTAYIEGKKAYGKLLKATQKAQALDGADFTIAKEATKAEHAVRDINENKGKVSRAAGSIFDLVIDTYPAAPYEEFGDTFTDKNLLVKELKSEREVTDFRVAPYAMGPDYWNLEPPATSCDGEVIGLPKVSLGLNGCAIVCDQTLYPKACVGFAHYQVSGTDDLCYLFSDVGNVDTFEPPEAALLQRSLRSASGAAPEPASATCRLKMAAISSGFRPKGELRRNKRWFGADGGFEPRTATEFYDVPEDVKILGETVLEKLE